MTTNTSAPSSEAGPAPDWRRIGSFVTGQAAVQCGSFALIIAMNWTAVQLGGRGAVTLVILASTLPRALMLLFGGALADALGPRAVLLRATATRLAVLVIGALVTAGAESIWPLVAVAVVEGSLLGLTGPASGVLLTRLAPKEHLGRANSLFSMVMRLAPMAGSPLGAWLVVAYSLSGVMLVSAAGCAVWLVCAFHVTRGMGQARARRGGGGTSLFRRSGDGLALLGRHPRLRWMFVACFCMDFAFLVGRGRAAAARVRRGLGYRLGGGGPHRVQRGRPGVGGGRCRTRAPHPRPGQADRHRHRARRGHGVHGSGALAERFSRSRRARSASSPG